MMIMMEVMTYQDRVGNLCTSSQYYCGPKTALKMSVMREREGVKTATK